MTTATAVPEAMTRQATVAEASQVERKRTVNGQEIVEVQWAMKLDIKDISQFPIPCFMPLERAAQVLKGSTHLVTMRRGKTKQGKEGKYPSEFFWDLTDWDVKQTATQQMEGALGRAQASAAQAPSATERPALAPIILEGRWDLADTQSRISWAQAVNLAVEAIGVHDFRGNEVMRQDPLVYFADVEVLANRFYPLIRKGPTAQKDSIDPETLPRDAQQSPQQPRNGGPGAVGVPAVPPTPDFKTPGAMGEALEKALPPVSSKKIMEAIGDLGSHMTKGGTRRSYYEMALAHFAEE